MFHYINNNVVAGRLHELMLLYRVNVQSNVRSRSIVAVEVIPHYIATRVNVDHAFSFFFKRAVSFVRHHSNF